MPIKTWGFGVPTVKEPQLGTFFVIHDYKWRGLGLAVEQSNGQATIILHIDGDIGDGATAPRLYQGQLSRYELSEIPAEALTIRPRTGNGVRPFLVPADTASHGSLLILSTGEPVLAYRRGGYADWSLATGKLVASSDGAIAYPEWEIATCEPNGTIHTIASFLPAR